MLDLFGNVFGKNKNKSANSNQQQQSGSGHADDTPNDNESYVFVNTNMAYTQHQTTILTDELIRMGSSSSVMPPAHGTHPANAPSSSTAGQTVYPSLDVTNGYNPSLPFSSTAAGTRHSLGVAGSRSSSSSLARNASPIDNVPFSLSNFGGNSAGGGGGGAVDDDGDVSETLSRIQQFMSNPNLSEYNFKLENSILRESLLT